VHPSYEREKDLALFDEEQFEMDESLEGIEAYVTEWESVPSALESVLADTGLQFGVFNQDVEDDTETTTTAVRTKWGDATDGMITDWSQMLGDFIASGDIFKGDFKGLMDGLSTIFTDTLGNMLTMFVTDFVGGILSGASTAADGILSSLGSAFGGGADGAGGLAGGVNSLVSGIGSLANPVSLIAQGVGAVASVITALQGPGGPSSTASWHFEQIWINTKELRDYTFLNIGGSSGWLAGIKENVMKVHVDHQDTRKLLRSKVGDRLKDISNDTSSMEKDIGKMPGLLKDISKSISKVSGAQEGHKSTQPELVMVHGTPQDPEWTLRESQMKNLGGGGGSIFNMNMPTSININGTILSDREYMRSHWIPELISAIRSNFGKSELKSALGVS